MQEESRKTRLSHKALMIMTSVWETVLRVNFEVCGRQYPRVLGKCSNESAKDYSRRHLTPAPTPLTTHVLSDHVSLAPPVPHHR